MLSTHGKWLITPREYVEAVLRYSTEIGRLTWAAPQDCMCEPFILAKTGLTEEVHQERTVGNYHMLNLLWGEMTDRESPFIPVLQGYRTIESYQRCELMYEASGIDLSKQRTVGIGSICRLQATGEIGGIVEHFAQEYKLHGFGVKMFGLDKYGKSLQSSDSMAWSMHARRRQPLPGHWRWHINCANCLTYAMIWRESLLTGRTDLLPRY